MSETTYDEPGQPDQGDAGPKTPDIDEGQPEREQPTRPAQPDGVPEPLPDDEEEAQRKEEKERKR